MILQLVVLAVILLLAVWLFGAITGVRFVNNTRIGIVEKRFSGKGSIKSGFIALHGEAGYQPQVLRGGLHFLRPLQYKVHTAHLVTIPQGTIGYIFARDGVSLTPGQVLASNAGTTDFQDATAFLQSGGQRGPQRQLLREGTYAINLAQFVVITEQRIHALTLGKEDEEIINRMAATLAERKGFRPVVIKDQDDLVGIVTVQDGPSLPEGEIIAPTLGDNPADEATYHNKFQDADRFLASGGFRGRQLQVLVEGTYYINRLFATIEVIPKTVVEVGYAGVVVSYTGQRGEDLSGKEYRHGELVARGHRGVWSEPLLPGKYAFNTYAGKVVLVPTTNLILKWSRAEVGSHGFDENLSEVSLITKDAFEPNLPLAVVIHIDYREAPLVIQRFGDIKRLVEQTLDPMVGAYFKNVGQTRTLIELIQERSLIQQVAGSEMQTKFAHYNLKLEEVLIGTPSSSPGDNKIEVILTQLRNRQIAEEQVETYARQEKAAVKERELREAEARAQQQRILTESEVSITIQSNQGKAEYQRALQQAAQIRALAEAEAEKAARIGIGQAIAIEEQVRAYGGPQYRVTQEVMTRFAEAVQHSGVEIVPRVLITDSQEGGNGSSGSAMEALMAMLLSERMGVPLAADSAERPPEVDAMRRQIRDALMRESASAAASVPELPSITVPTLPTSAPAPEPAAPAAPTPPPSDGGNGAPR